MFNKWIQGKASCLPSSVLVVTFCLLSKAKTSMIVYSGPALIRFLRRVNADDELGGMSAVCPLLPFLSWAILLSETIYDLQMLLLISSISRKWKSFCWGIKRITNWSITNPVFLLIWCVIYIYCYILLWFNVTANFSKRCIPARACPMSTLLGRRSQRPSRFWLENFIEW